MQTDGLQAANIINLATCRTFQMHKEIVWNLRHTKSIAQGTLVLLCKSVNQAVGHLRIGQIQHEHFSQQARINVVI